MNTKKLIILTAVALAAIGLGLWIAGNRSSHHEVASAELFPDLKKTLNDATAVRIFTAGDKQTVEIARKDSAWVVNERHGYPADDAKLRKLLLSLANATVREEKTSNPENYSSLGVEDVTAETATGIRIEVAGAQPVINLIVGKQGPSPESQYVRKVGEKSSWLVDTNIDTTSLPQDWLRKSLLEVSADRIQSASIQAKSGKPYTATKNAKTDATFTVQGLPKGKQPSSPSATNPLATALAGVPLSDVGPASTLDGAPDATATYKTFDGLVLELKGWSRADKHYLAAQSRYDEALANRFKVSSEPAQPAQGEGKQPDAATSDQSADDQKMSEPAKAPPAANVADEAKALNERLDGWAFEIPQYKYTAIFKPADDLVAE